MKLTIERADLLSALTHVQSVVERRNTIPILSNVLLDASDGGLVLTATDLDLSITERTSAEIAQPGATTAPAHTLYDIARKLPEGSQVEIDATGGDGQLHLNAGRSRFALSALPRDDFPHMAEGEFSHNFTVAAGDLRRLVDKTRFAISTEETRYYLNGVYMHAAQGDGVSALRAVATDGHRLARVEMPLPQGAEGLNGVIVPRKLIGELRKLLDQADAEVAVSLSDTKIRVACGNVVLLSKLIDGAFPDYGRVIPEHNDKMMEVDTAALAEAVDRVSTISTEKSRAVKLAVEGDRLMLSASSPDAGSADEEISVSFGADPLEIGFNSRYLLDIITQVEGQNAQFLMADAGSPTLIRDTEDDGALFVLMPMRV